MPIKKEDKNKIIKMFAKSDKDTGSCELQVALVSERIRQIAGHLKSFPKDKHSRTGLLKLVGKRRTFLKYIKRKDVSSYTNLVKNLKENGYLR